MKKINYIKTSIGLYINFFMYGMQSIVISQNASYFSKRWNTDIKGIMAVIACVGLGKFVSIWISGEMSDKFGRKLLVNLGMTGIVIFFLGLLFSKSYILAMAASFLSGVSISMLDAGTYPALQDLYKHKQGSALVGIKGIMSLGQMIYPIFVGILVKNNLWLGWSIILPLTILLLNFITMIRGSYPYDDKIKSEKKEINEKDEENIKKSKKTISTKEDVLKENNIIVNKPIFYIEGICCIFYGFVAMTTFYLISQVLTIYGAECVGMSDMASRALISYYTIGSVSAVISTSFLMSKGVRPVLLLLIYTIFSTIFLILLSLIKTELVAIISSFFIGFFAAGGNLQSGIAVIGEFFPNKKGRNIGFYYTFMGLGSFLSPYVASKLIAVNFDYILYFDATVSFLGVILMTIISIRYKSVFAKSIFSRSMKY